MRITLGIVLLGLALAGCSSPTPTQVPQAPAATTAPAASPGKAKPVQKPASKESELQGVVLADLASLHGVKLDKVEELNLRTHMSAECADYRDGQAINGPTWVDRFDNLSVGLTREQAGFMMLRTLNTVCKAL